MSVFVRKYAVFPKSYPPTSLGPSFSRAGHENEDGQKDGQHLGWRRRSVTLTFGPIIFSSATMSVVLPTHLASDDYLPDCSSVDTEIQIQIQIQMKIQMNIQIQMEKKREYKQIHIYIS